MTLDLLHLSFAYPGQSGHLFQDLDFQFSRGWTGIVGPNGSGKTTLMLLVAGELEPSAGRIRAPGDALYCQQRTDDPPVHLRNLVQTPDGLSAELVGRLGLCCDWPNRWQTLSHGERKRAQIACALWRRPSVLLVDEPTNHVDAATRAFLADALATFRGVGLLVSHDRELLDRLCQATLLLTPPNAILRPGGYSAARASLDLEEQARRHDRQVAQNRLHRLQAEAHERRIEADAADARRSKRHMAKHDHDAKSTMDLARLTGKDAIAGRLLRQLEGRLVQTQQRAATIHVQKERKLGLGLSGELARRALLLHMPEQQLALGPDRTLHVPRLLLRPDDRVGVWGVNGSGKSTLIRHIVASLDLPADKLVYLPQEVDAQASVDLNQQVQRLSPAMLGDVMAAVACLGSEPQRLLQTDSPSPGEVRKLMLALGLAHRPNLIVMDEPTNHLDLPSIECLEEALKECRCALILVSHDHPLLRRLTRTRWEIVDAQLKLTPWAETR